MCPLPADTLNFTSLGGSNLINWLRGGQYISWEEGWGSGRIVGGASTQPVGFALRLMH